MGAPTKQGGILRVVIIVWLLCRWECSYMGKYSLVGVVQSVTMAPSLLLLLSSLSPFLSPSLLPSLLSSLPPFPLFLLPPSPTLPLLPLTLPSDIHDFYSYTLEDAAKTTQVKTEETLTLAERWEKHPPPVPTETRDLAEKALDAQVSLEGGKEGKREGGREGGRGEEGGRKEGRKEGKREGGMKGGWERGREGGRRW